MVEYAVMLALIAAVCFADTEVVVAGQTLTNASVSEIKKCELALVEF